MSIPSNRQFQLIATSVTVILTSLAIFAVQSKSDAVVKGAALTRHKRHILQLCELVSVHTNRACFDYNNYGCFCGLGNADSYPVDAVDSCCRSHDRCYANIECFWLYPHFVGYSYECTPARCQCTDSPTVSPCSHSTCTCDMKLARCLASTTFNPNFSSYNREECVKRESKRKKRKKKSVKKMKVRRQKKLKHNKHSNELS